MSVHRFRIAKRAWKFPVMIDNVDASVDVQWRSLGDFQKVVGNERTATEWARCRRNKQWCS